MSQPEITILVSSFERPRHVSRVLASIAAQRGVAGAFEVIVTDDGSRDQTPRMVRQFAASVNFPVRFLTHPHEGYHIARCRNEGVAASAAPYLLFLDGDCIIPPDHVRTHLDRRQPGNCLAGYPIHIKQTIAEQITENDVRRGSYLEQVATYKHLNMRWRHVRAVLYSLIGSPTRPKLLGGNLGIARADYERVNGYDENFRGWGCEDDDLRMRLRAAGIGVKSIAWWTNTYHLWHPKTPSAPAKWRAGVNVGYFSRPMRLTRCAAGMTRRRLQDLTIDLVGCRPSVHLLDRWLPTWCRSALATARPRYEPAEIEIAFAGGSAAPFTQQADCRVLIVPPGQTPDRASSRHADLVFAARSACGRNDRDHPLHDLDATLRAQLGFQAAVHSRPAQSTPAAELLALPSAA